MLNLPKLMLTTAITTLLMGCAASPHSHNASSTSLSTVSNDSDSSDFSISQLRDEATVTVNEDYSYEFIFTGVNRLNDRTGVEDYSEDTIWYDPDYDTLEIVEAYTTKANGKRIDVDPNEIIDAATDIDATTLKYINLREKTVIFPNTAVGDTTTLTYKIVSKPKYGNHLEFRGTYADYIPYDSASVKISIPNNIPLNIDVKGGKQSKQVKGDRTYWTWTFKDTPSVFYERQSAFDINSIPHVFVSTLKDYSKLGKHYYDLNQHKVKVTPKTQALADKITAGIPKSDTLAQATAIYNWMSDNINLVDVKYYTKNMTAHDVDTIITNGFGDSKDHNILTQSLLLAKGIDSRAVLVDFGNDYTLSKVPLIHYPFDYVITYIPALDVYVDTALEGTAQFGIMSRKLSSKPALLIDKPSKIVTLPISYKRSNIDNLSQITLLEDGTAKGTSKNRMAGRADFTTRAWLEGEEDYKSELVQNLLEYTDQVGRGSYKTTDIYDLTAPFEWDINFELDDVYDPDYSGSFILPIGVSNGLDPYTLEDFTIYSIEDREMPITSLFDIRIHDAITYTLPDTIEVTHLPKDTKVSNSVGSYNAHYEQTGNNITVTRDLVIQDDKAVLPVSDYAKVIELDDAIYKDFNQVVKYNVK